MRLKMACLGAMGAAALLTGCAGSPAYEPLSGESAQPQSNLRILGEQELVDILVGSCIQSTRNCDPSGPIEQVRAALADGATFTLLEPAAVPDDGVVVAVQGIGGGGPWQHVIDRTTEQGLPRMDDAAMEQAVVELFADHIGKDVTALVRSEAAGATATALLLGAKLGIPTLDAGITGRAVPEVQQSIPWINKIASVPTAVITPFGDQIIIRHAVDEYRVEDLTRAIAVASGGDAFITMTPMNGSDLDRGVLAGNIGEAEAYGRTVREAVDAGEDPIAALIDISGGYRLFEGVVTASEERGERGFNWVEAEFAGTGAYEGETYRVYVKNENIVGWRNGELDAVSPDYIYNLDPETGQSTLGVGYGGYVVGERVAFVGVPAPAPWRSERGIELIGPRHFGFNFDYVPLEELQAD
jgi:uncharacterized protein